MTGVFRYELMKTQTSARRRLFESENWLLLITGLGTTIGLLGCGSLVSDGDPAPPVGCSASNVAYYYDAETGEINDERMNRLEWIPVSAADSAQIVGCVPQLLADPTNDNSRVLLEFGDGDPNVPLPIFKPDGSLFGYFVVYKGSVPLDEAIANGDVPERLIADPPKVSDFDADFTPNSG